MSKVSRATIPGVGRYICTGCGVRYGTPGRAEYSFCPGCWDLHLRTTERDIRREYVSRMEARGQRPVWPFGERAGE